jgi:hypothetical protein
LQFLKISTKIRKFGIDGTQIAGCRLSDNSFGPLSAE